ncbi:hypothetical protein evm_003928 [Chilo suppressalis]|nr:hypothetical protein evm_003928 [Chilo suppressalis]
MVPWVFSVCFLVFSVKIAASEDPPCIIDLECPECIPDNMPLVTSHRAVNGSVRAQSRDEVLLSCGGGKFLAFPLRTTLTAVCEAGRYRLHHDHSLRHLLELGCQESVLEDVLHQVEHCPPPLQGRAYQLQVSAGRTRHLALVCFDADRGRAERARAGRLTLAPHIDRAAPLTLLGNFNHMFDARTRRDAERLYRDRASLNRRLQEILKHDRVSLAGQTLTSASLLAPHYFKDQEMRAADFVSNEVAVWRSVADGNLKHLRADVARLLSLNRELEVHAGTHGVASLRGADNKRVELYLSAARRFPVPLYVWTAVVDPVSHAGLALVLLNDPFVAVSEIREAVFCDSMCGRAAWLRELHRNRHYEVPLYGLVFCCELHNFTRTVPELPAALVQSVRRNEEGMLFGDFA